MAKENGPMKKIGGFIKKHKKLFIVLVIIIALIVVMVVKTKSAANQMAAVDTSSFTTTVEKMDLQSSVSVTGTLAATDTVSVTSTIQTGTEVKAINYEVGDYVEEGQVVVEFDGDDLDEQLSDLDLSNQITNLQNDHQLQQVQDYLEDNYYKYLNVVELKAEYEANKDNGEIAERYETENAAVGGIDNFIETYENYQYQLQLYTLQNQQSANQQEDNYEDVYESIDATQVTAPISGYITAINVEVGNNYTQGSTIFTIMDTSGFVVEATVDEYDIASLEKGMQCVVKFDATDDDEFSGELTYVAISTGSSSSSTSTTSAYSTSSSSSSGSYEIKITLNDTDDRLRAGMTAKASVILNSAEDVLGVPYDCVETDSDGNSYVTVVDDNNNETKTQVTVVMESDYYVAIEGDGIAEGTKVKATASSGSSDAFDMDEMGMTFEMNDQGGGQGGAPDGGGQGGPGGGF